MNWNQKPAKATEKEELFADLKPRILHALKDGWTVGESDLVDKLQDSWAFCKKETLDAFPKLIHQNVRELETAGHVRRFADRLYPDRLGWCLTDSGLALLTEKRFFTAGPVTDTIKRTADMITEIQKQKAVQTDTDIIRKYGKIEAVIEMYEAGGDCCKVKAFSTISDIIRENQ
jgi:hypothetical protein